jgi:hypothetical protein
MTAAGVGQRGPVNIERVEGQKEDKETAGSSPPHPGSQFTVPRLGGAVRPRLVGSSGLMALRLK